MANRLISEDYVRKEWEMQVARKLKPIMYELGAGRAKEGNINTGKWEKSNHRIYVSASSKHGNKRNIVTFSKFRYTSDTEMVYGKASLIQDDSVEVDGTSRTFQNSTDEPITANIAREVTLGSDVQHSFSQKYSISVENETQVSGKYAGVEVQNTLKIAFGMEFDKSQTESESKSTTDTFSFDFTVPAHSKVLASLIKNKLETETPFTVKGYFDCAIKVDFEDWAGKHQQGRRLFKGWHKGRKEFDFNSLLEFEQFLKGFHVNYPRMDGFYETASRASQDAMDWIFDKENRVMDLEGVKNRSFENNVDVSIEKAA